MLGNQIVTLSHREETLPTLGKGDEEDAEDGLLSASIGGRKNFVSGCRISFEGVKTRSEEIRRERTAVVLRYTARAGVYTRGTAPGSAVANLGGVTTSKIPLGRKGDAHSLCLRFCLGLFSCVVRRHASVFGYMRVERRFCLFRPL